MSKHHQAKKAARQAKEEKRAAREARREERKARREEANEFDGDESELDELSLNSLPEGTEAEEEKGSYSDVSDSNL